MRPAPDQIVHSSEPFNAEPPPDRLIAAFTTPQRDFYVRSHGEVPQLGPDHRIEVIGETVRSWSADELRAAFPERHVIATLQCAGNRRAHLQEVAPTAGDPWGVGAIGNAAWTGVALADVLAAVGIPADTRFVNLRGADEVTVEGETAAFEIAVPLAKALSAEVLVAWAMNDEPLAPEHGAPLRLVTPGFAGIRSAKWLTRIALAAAPSTAPIQARDYKLFPASVTKDDVDWSRGTVIDSLPVNAAICVPRDSGTVAAGRCRVSGYATASARGIARVEVSANGGADWIQAAIVAGADEPWSWKQWQAEVDLAPGRCTLTVRAVDEAGQIQPERPESVWNFAGYLAAAWHRIELTVTG